MDIRPIRSDEDHRAALAEIDAEILFDLDGAERAELRSLLGRLSGV